MSMHRANVHLGSDHGSVDVPENPADTRNKGKATPTARKREDKKLPHLSLSAALEWRRAKKENEKLLKKILNCEVPQLPGEWALW